MNYKNPQRYKNGDISWEVYSKQIELIKRRRSS